MNVTQSYYTLKHWEEARGKVKDIEEKNNLILLEFVGGTKIKINTPSEEVANMLMNSICKNVQILRTDIMDKEYCVKIFEEIAREKIQ